MRIFATVRAEGRGDRPGRSRIFRDFTLVRARAEPLAHRQKTASGPQRSEGQPAVARPVKKGTRRRVSIAPPLGGTRDRVPPASDSMKVCFHSPREGRIANTSVGACINDAASDTARASDVTEQSFQVTFGFALTVRNRRALGSQLRFRANLFRFRINLYDSNILALQIFAHRANEPYR